MAHSSPPYRGWSILCLKMKKFLLKHGTIYPVSKKPFVGDILIEDKKIDGISERIEE